MAQRQSRSTGLERLRTYLAEQGFEPQQKLPPERELAPLLGISRTTLRACLETLETEGLVWRHVGQGTFYGKRPGSNAVRLSLLVEMASPWDIMEARLLLEPQVVVAASKAATPDQIAFLRSCVKAGREAKNIHRCEVADAEFHSALARATGNPVFVSFLEFLAGARGRARWQREWLRTYHHIGEDEFRGGHSDHHQAIVDAIAARDAVRAEAMMRHHLTAVYDAMKQAAGEGV